MPSTQILEVKGNGLALIDYNKDGHLDLFVPNGATLADPERGPGWRLFANTGSSDVHFNDVTQQVGIAHTRWALGAAVADFDNDGWDDLYITCYGDNVLLRNAGGSRFIDVSDAAGVAYGGWSTSAAFGDVTGDGALDLYIANYLEFDAASPPPQSEFLGTRVLAGPRGFPAQHDALHRNNRAGAFEDISESSGVRSVQPAFGLGAVILDFDGDGRQDIFVGNDSMRNFLFHNIGGDGSQPFLVDRGLQSGIGANADGANQATMGIAIADINGNNLPDVFTTNFSSDTNTLHLNAGDMFFDDRTAQYGLGQVSRTFLGWACGFFDFDHDGSEELFIVNGHVYPNASRELMDSDYEQPPLLFQRRPGDPQSRFERASAQDVGTWLDVPRRDRAAVFGDLTGDGSIDVVIGEMNGPIRVLRNDSTAVGGWLVVELLDDRPQSHNRAGLGSRVQLMHKDTGQSMTRWIYGGGFMSANPFYAHFGIPSDWLDRSAELTLRITWPDGAVQDVTLPKVNRRVRIDRAPSTVGD